MENNLNVMLCYCICINVFCLLSELIEMRRNELKVNKIVLNFFIRRCIFVFDYCMLLRVIGVVGIIIIVIFGILIICFDVFFVFYLKFEIV